MSQQTPKWWADDRKIGSMFRSIRTSDTGQPVCRVHGSGIMQLEERTRLILAAPELLEACEKVVDWAKKPDGSIPQSQSLKLLCAAIALATV